MIREGTNVKWNWGNGEATGEVEEVFHREVTRTLKGEEVTRKGSDDNPAYLIQQDDGDKVLKLKSEVERA
ncbi:DUF2945 domain-containing protein [Pseudooceanicola sp. MF1-13]|uniref:DUF2945 domain-containing protein n=1 Tax=Pseudooceanicola sp. MF1-13 TaxID=3379095 RepID=UPI00389213A5